MKFVNNHGVWVGDNIYRSLIEVNTGNTNFGCNNKIQINRICTRKMGFMKITKANRNMPLLLLFNGRKG